MGRVTTDSETKTPKCERGEPALVRVHARPDSRHVPVHAPAEPLLVNTRSGPEPRQLSSRNSRTAGSGYDARAPRIACREDRRARWTGPNSSCSACWPRVVTLYITRWLPIEVTSLLVPPILFGTGILDVKHALSGFSNSATITIACMFVLSAGLYRTGALDLLTEFLKKHAKGSPLRLLLVLAVTVPFISAVMNNIPVVAMLLPVVLALARDMDVKPSRLLIPMSYFAILGGTTTLLGTGTNILVDDFYRESQAAAGPGSDGTRDVLVHAAGARPARRRAEPSSCCSDDASSRTAPRSPRCSPRSGPRSSSPRSSSTRTRRSRAGRWARSSPRAVRSVSSSSSARSSVLIGREARDLELASGDTMIITGKPKETAEFLEQVQAQVQTGGKKVDARDALVRAADRRGGGAARLALLRPAAGRPGAAHAIRREGPLHPARRRAPAAESAQHAARGGRRLARPGVRHGLRRAAGHGGGPHRRGSRSDRSGARSASGSPSRS